MTALVTGGLRPNPGMPTIANPLERGDGKQRATSTLKRRCESGQPRTRPGSPAVPPAAQMRASCSRSHHFSVSRPRDKAREVVVDLAGLELSPATRRIVSMPRRSPAASQWPAGGDARPACRASAPDHTGRPSTPVSMQEQLHHAHGSMVGPRVRRAARHSQWTSPALLPEPGCEWHEPIYAA